MSSSGHEGAMDAATLRAELEGKFDYVRYTYTDIPGTCRHKLIPTRNAVQTVGSCVYSGIVACGPLTEAYIPAIVEQMNFPNATLRPMTGTLRSVPWASSRYKTAMVMCETFWMDGSVQEANPRTLARRQLARLDDMGYSLLNAFETEFIIMDPETHKPVFPTADYCETVSFRPFEEFFMDLDQHMLAAGVDLECVHAEHGPGQFETILRPTYGVEAADQAFILKTTMKELISDKNLLANYMAQPLFGESGNGTHLNFSLWDTKSKSNVFYNKDGVDGLSDIGRWWLGGLVYHADALCALLNSTVNCYRRIHEPWAADYNDWNIDDRMASFRVKNYSPTATYFENRIPSGASNPYIVLGATIAAGLDGINRKIEPPPKGRAGSQRLPDTLADALDALQRDAVLCEGLGTEFVEWYIGNKREVDLKVLGNPDPKANSQKALDAEYAEYARLC